MPSLYFLLTLIHEKDLETYHLLRDFLLPLFDVCIGRCLHPLEPLLQFADLYLFRLNLQQPKHK